MSTFEVDAVGLGLNVTPWGGRVDFQPSEGSIIESCDHFVAQVSGPAKVTVFDPSLFRVLPQKGWFARITPYARRHFDGSRLDAPRVTNAGGVTFRLGHFGKAVSSLPVASLTAEGAHVLDHIERARCPDNVRVLSNLLVDIGANSFEWTESALDGFELRFKVATGKFQGLVALKLDSAMDFFTVEMYSADGATAPTHRVASVSPDQLAQVMSTLLCDGSWRFANVQTVAEASPSLMGVAIV